MKNWKHNTLESPEAAAGGVFCSKKEKEKNQKWGKEDEENHNHHNNKNLYDRTEPPPSLPDGRWVFVEPIYPRAQHTQWGKNGV